MSAIDQSVLSLAQSLTGTLNGVRANDGSGGQWPPHGEHVVVVEGFTLKPEKVKYGPKGQNPQEADGFSARFTYRLYHDKSKPGYDPKSGDYLEFLGSPMTFMPGWEKLGDKEQTRFRMSAERFIQSAVVLLGLPEDQCKNPVAVLPKIVAAVATKPSVSLFCEHRENTQNGETKVYKTDFSRELLNGQVSA